MTNTSGESENANHDACEGADSAVSADNLPDLSPGTKITVEYQSVFGSVDSSSELDATVTRIDVTTPELSSVATEFTIYLSPDNESDDQRQERYKDLDSPPRRLYGQLDPDGDPITFTLQNRNGYRWNRLSRDHPTVRLR